MAVASGRAGPSLAGPGFSSSAQSGFTLVGGHVMGWWDMHVMGGWDRHVTGERDRHVMGGRDRHVMGGRDRHVQIHKFYLSCSATAIELYLSCVAMSRDIPEKPHQPRDFNFPKRFWGAEKVVMRSYQPTWFSQWPLLHYCEAQDVVY